MNSIAFALLLFVIVSAIGVPIAISFFISGFVGISSLLGIKQAITMSSSTLINAISSPTFAALPLYILMGAFAAQGGFAKRTYDGLYKLTVRIPGALAIATCFACGFFGAICGSPIATTAVFGKVALPEMDRLKYDRGLSLGVIASAGTFASMIPPSTGLIIYAMFTDQSIARIFLAGVVPGILTAFVYSLSIYFRVKKTPTLAPKWDGKDFTFKEKLHSVKNMWPLFLLIFVVLGGIYSGIFTPTEAAAVGAIVTLVLGIFDGSIRNLKNVTSSVKQTAQTTAMIFFIIIGAMFFSRFVSLGHIAEGIMEQIQSMHLHKHVILLLIMVAWFFLGMIMESTAIKALVLPIIFPLIVSLGYDPIWFGIIAQKLSEIAVVTPPLGLNVYTMKAVAGKGTTLEQVFRGIWPFVIADIAVLFLLVLFPGVVLWLPNLLLK